VALELLFKNKHFSHNVSLEVIWTIIPWLGFRGISYTFSFSLLYMMDGLSF